MNSPQNNSPNNPPLCPHLPSLLAFADMPLSKEQQLAELYKQQLRAISSYYLDVDDTPLLTDESYTQLCHQIQVAEADLPLRATEWFSTRVWVASNRNTPFENAPHQTPMLSLTNLYQLQEITEWHDNLQRSLPEASLDYLGQLKLDGVAVSLHYQAGLLTQALTRGDGKHGENITRNMKTLKNVPHRLKQKVDLIVRGEVCYPFAAFEKENQQRKSNQQEEMKNPRNAAAGLMLTLDSTTTSHHNLELYVYELETESASAVAGSPPNALSILSWLKELGLPVIDCSLKKTLSLAELTDFYQQCSADRHQLALPVDGIVVKLNSMQQRAQLGSTAKSPRWAVALKFPAEKAYPVLLGVELKVGRTGRINPIANLEPIQLAGTTVTRATLHNFDQIERLKLRIGVRVQVEKGGDIIPKVVGLAPPQTDSSQGTTPKLVPISAPISIPICCPSCQTPIQQKIGEVDYYCHNPLCPQQCTERLCHFVSRPAMYIETLGPAVIEQLLAKKWVHTWADLYHPERLNADKLASLEHLGVHSAQLIMANIAKSKQAPLARFLHAIGIRYVGVQLAQILADLFGSLETLQQVSLEQLLEISSIGTVVAESIKDFFSDPFQLALIDQARSFGLNPKPTATRKLTALSGKRIVITGTLSISRDEWKQRLMQNGAIVSGTLSKTTDILLAGDHAGSKKEKASKLAIPICDELQITQMLAAELPSTLVDLKRDSKL